MLAGLLIQIAGCEIKCVIWVQSRIMAIGWNRRVTEFSDSDAAVGPGGAFSKDWDLRHKEDISSAAVRVPQVSITTSGSPAGVTFRTTFFHFIYINIKSCFHNRNFLIYADDFKVFSELTCSHDCEETYRTI